MMGLFEGKEYSGMAFHPSPMTVYSPMPDGARANGRGVSKAAPPHTSVPRTRLAAGLLLQREDDVSFPPDSFRFTSWVKLRRHGCVHRRCSLRHFPHSAS